MKYGVVLFYTTSSVMQAEKILKKDGLSIKLIPVPRQFSSDCGISLRFEWSDYERVKEALTKANVELQDFYQL